jgi:hypothetical protein
MLGRTEGGQGREAGAFRGTAIEVPEEGGACRGAAVGAVEDDKPRRCTHTSRGVGEDESTAARAGECGLRRPPPQSASMATELVVLRNSSSSTELVVLRSLSSSTALGSSSSSTAPQVGEGQREQGRRARPRAQIGRARGSRALN